MNRDQALFLYGNLINNLELGIIICQPSSFIGMGASGHRACFKTMDQHEWESVPGDYGRRRILRNRFNGRQMEEYSVVLSNQFEIAQYYDVFNWRLGSDCLVNALNYQVLEQQNYCGSLHNLLVYVERIKNRLSAYQRLSEEDAVYALQSSLQGFQQIYRKFGYVDVEESMFCINKQNQLRVWLSEDLSHHRPWVPYMGKRRSQSEMVKIIIDIIDSKLGKEHHLRSFIRQICQSPRFEEAKFITMLYMKQKSIEPRYHLQSLDKCFFKTCESIEEKQLTPKYSYYGKNSLSRLLLYNEQDSVHQTKNNFQSQIASQLEQRTSDKQNNITATTSAQITHMKRTSGLTVTDSQNLTGKKLPAVETNQITEQIQKSQLPQTVFSVSSTPGQLSAIVETQHESKESKESRRSSVTIPQFPMSTKNSEREASKKISFHDVNKSRVIKQPNESNMTISANSNRSKQPAGANTNSYDISNSKVSIKNIKKISLTPADIKAELNKIRRTFSICVASQKLLPLDLRYHASELVEPHNNIISYEVITSEECEGFQRGSPRSPKFR